MEVEDFAGAAQGQDGPVRLVVGHEEEAELGQARPLFEEVGVLL